MQFVECWRNVWSNVCRRATTRAQVFWTVRGRPRLSRKYVLACTELWQIKREFTMQRAPMFVNVWVATTPYDAKHVRKVARLAHSCNLIVKRKAPSRGWHRDSSMSEDRPSVTSPPAMIIDLRLSIRSIVLTMHLINRIIYYIITSIEHLNCQYTI